MEVATVLETYEDAIEAKPGLYVVHSGTGAYFPAMGFIEEGYAKFLGEFYDERGRVVTFKITAAPAVAARNPIEPFEHRITISPQFFLAALKDYKDWELKWWREAVQNAVDAGATHIELGVVQNADGTYTVWCDDNGRGMDVETFRDKFLMLGGTSKTAAGGTAGGFGKAKELLILPWISWNAHSRDINVQGVGDQTKFYPAEMRMGTRLEVVMPPDKRTTGAIALGFVEKCYLPNIRFTITDVECGLDHKVFVADLIGGHPIERLPDKIDFYFIPADSHQSYMYIRTNGIFMFEHYIGSVPGFMIGEITAPSIEILAANRDGFRDRQVGYAVDSLAERIAKDTKSALRNKQGLIRKKYEGSGKFRSRTRAAMLFEQIGAYNIGPLSAHDTSKILATVGDYAREQEATLASMSAGAASAMLDQKFLGPNHLENALKQLVWEPDFFIMNDIEHFVIPKKFFPETMTPTILKLAKTWVELCRFVFMQLGTDREFGVGFYFSTGAAASALFRDEERERFPTPWIMLNPFKDMDTRQEIWRPAVDADLKWLYAAAIHEVTHVADRIEYHDESFAAALTLNMAKCADGYRKIRQIVASIRMRGGPEL